MEKDNKELGVIFGTEEEAIWDNVRRNTERTLIQMKDELQKLPSAIKVQEDILKFAEDKLKDVVKV